LFMAEYIYGDIEILRATGEPCIVCGDPTGNCVPTGHKPPEKLLGLGIFQSLDDKQTFRVEEDFFVPEEVSAGVITKVRKFAKGQIIPLTEARKYNLTRN
jgi:hypothetical protein